MLIRCWGARGSIPVSGKQYERYGGDSPCMEVRDRFGGCLIIDCGTGIRRLGMRLMQEGIEQIALIMTHFHWDHVLGLPFFRPLYQSSTRITLYGWPKVQGNVQEKLFHVMAPPHFPVPARDISARITTVSCEHSSLDLGGLHIETIALNHPNQGLGFRITEQGRSFVFLTDNELGKSYENGSSYARFVDFCQGADLLVHDGEYTREEYELTRTWGHSRYEDAVRLAADARVARLGLFHHNQERSDTDIDRIVLHCREILAARGSTVDCFAVAQDMQWTLG
ncbi:MBL fold metallo-hydrolase [Desulfoplanes formicivorans]|uniref:Metal-dependent hydrolase n=1 Tax=Desulfoplanes formicivorans TaxID=1592317 RepID=A0A194AGL3_9BACT|nr:MBL fold metallo-hydrolase [Desulfoplanes formicivorans]GAU08350.1 metal-dependent hydrolase [Desulfoplanes formicivorans]